MFSITDYVRQIIANRPTIAELLCKNYINLSSLAQDLVPEIESITLKKVSKNAVVMALSRIQKEIKIPAESIFWVNDIQVKYPLSEINYPIPLQFCTEEVNSIYKKIHTQENHNLNIVSGNSETTIFINTKLKNLIFESFEGFVHNLELDQLASVSLKFDQKYLQEVGITYQVLQSLAWNKINLVEVVSTYTEITLIIDQKNVQKLIEILNKNFMV
jgi:hypothetical protein